ncbi:MAG: hypothetical protein LBT54_04555 [Bifidobacteriaceae bacterium]|nr:hypothetical protein [Bifidobacteriaceae bacterium]
MIPEFFAPQDEWLDRVGRIYVLLLSAPGNGAAAGRRVELRRANRINTVRSSTAIEGNRLTLDQVTAVVNGHMVFGPERDVMEARNAWAAYEALDTFDPYSVDDLLRAHGLLAKGLITQSGEFRSRDVETVNEAGAVPHTGSRVAKAPRLIAEALEWAATTSAHPLVAAGAAHFIT